MTQYAIQDDSAAIAFPSFVQMSDGAAEIVRLWNPVVTGAASVDARAGYFAEALRYAQARNSPSFLVGIILEIRVSGISMVERAFLDQLVRKAILGGRNPGLPDGMAGSLAQLYGVSLPEIRDVEAAGNGVIVRRGDGP
jgi:hypothetical protein